MENLEIRAYNGHRLAVAYHDTATRDIVIFCHGYRSSSIGPNRFFVRAARRLAEHSIASLRFDQYGSGNSEGDFFDSSFNDWVGTTKQIARDYLRSGYRVALFGQSMGGSTVLAVGAEVPEISAIVAWVPDASADPFHAPENGIIEESGQIVRAAFWQEAHDAHIGELLPDIQTPVYIVQCTADEYVNKLNRDVLASRAQAHHKIDTFEGYKHSSWTYGQSEEIITRSVKFLAQAFSRPA
jgi:alpha-beta hydrolase superfamily lysophospholipase